jgi:hypothetical protein
MSVAAARVIIAVGKGRKLLRTRYAIPTSESLVEMDIAGSTRLIAFLPHPSRFKRGLRHLGGLYSPSEMRRLQDAVTAVSSKFVRGPVLEAFADVAHQRCFVAEEVGEAVHVCPDPLGRSAEIMRAVCMIANAGGVAFIEDVAAEMRPPLDHQDGIFVFVQSSGDGRSGKTGSHDKEVWYVQYERIARRIARNATKHERPTTLRALCAATSAKNVRRVRRSWRLVSKLVRAASKRPSRASQTPMR